MSINGKLTLTVSFSSLRPCAFLCAAALKKYEYYSKELLPSILVFFQRSGAEEGAGAQRKRTPRVIPTALQLS